MSSEHNRGKIGLKHTKVNLVCVWLVTILGLALAFYGLATGDIPYQKFWFLIGEVVVAWVLWFLGGRIGKDDETKD